MDGNAGHLLLDPICLMEWQKILRCIESTLKYKFPEIFSPRAASSFVSTSPVHKSVLYLSYFCPSLTSKDNLMREYPYYTTEYLAPA